MKILALLLSFISTSSLGCGKDSKHLFLELGAGHNGNTNNIVKWNNGGGTGAYIGIRYEGNEISWLLNGVPVVSYSHYSQYDVGPPSNDENESSLDSKMFIVKWGIL